MFGEKIGAFYAKIEEKWYGLLEALQARGLPVGAYNNFLEDRGLPSFPVTLGIIALIFCLFFAFVLIGKGVSPQLTIDVQDQFGKAVNGVMVEIKNSQGEVLLKKQVNGSETIPLESIPLGTELSLEASREGYNNANASTKISGEEGYVFLQLEKVFEYIDAVVRLEDVDTHDTINNASLFFEIEEMGTFEAKFSEENLFIFYGIPADTEGLLKISAPGYEEKQEPLTFQKDVMLTKQLFKKIIALQGKTKLLIKVMDSETKELIEGARIRVIDTSSNAIISEPIAQDGTYLEMLDAGMSVKVVVEKEQYLTYESISKTLIEEEEIIEVLMEKGGEKLTVILADEAGALLSEGTIQLWKVGAEDLTDEKTTGFAGTIEFFGLNPNESYFVTAYKAGYLPARKKINVAEEEIVTIKLKASNTENSAALNVTAIDEESKLVNNASIQFFEKIEEEILPIGIPLQYSDASGFVQQYLPIGKKVLVKAAKDLLKGEAETEILKGQNEVQIILFKPSGVIALTILGDDGKPVQGTVTVTSLNGELLFSGEIPENGEILFDKDNEDTVKLKVTFEDGKTFSSEINVKGKDKTSVVASESDAELTPQISFIGIFNEKDEIAEGMEKEKFYWLKFQAEFAKADYVAGIHVRVGDDNVSLVDSQAIAIYGFDAASDDFFLGRTYTSLPAPGNEGIDKQNKGIAGKENKWLELYYMVPENTEIFKVKVKAMMTLQEKEFSVKYRAWIDLENEFYRTPEDTVLGKQKYNNERNALYAETLEAKVKVFDAETVGESCNEGICLSYEFLNEKEERFKETEFHPMSDRVYALELKLRASEDLKPTVKVSTEKQNPALGLMSYQQDSFSFPTTGATQVEMQITATELEKDIEKVVRFYFKTTKAETTFLNVKIAAGEKIVEKEIYFNISQEGTLELAFEPENILIGQAFAVKVKDANNGSAVTDAGIKLFDKEKKQVRAVVGSNALDKGKNGVYKFASGLSPGYYVAKAEHPLYGIAEKPFFIAEQGLLAMAEEIRIEMPFNQKSKQQKEVLENKSKFIVKDFTYSLEEDDNWPEGLELSVIVPKIINGAEKNFITLQVSYNGKPEDRVHGEADLTVTGFIEGLFPVQLQTRVKISYNQPLPEECLKIDQDKIYVTIIGRGGVQEKAPLKVTNTCEEELNIKPYVEGQSQDNAMDITAQQFVLKAGEEKEIQINIANNAMRMFSFMMPYKYNFYLQAAQLTRSIPLIIIIKDPSFALQTNDNIHIYLKKESGKEGLQGSAPLYVMNVGEKPITNLRFNTMGHYGAVNLTIVPQNGMYSNNPTGSQYYQSNPLYNTGTFNSNIPYNTPQFLPQGIDYLPQSQLLASSVPYSPVNQYGQSPLSLGYAGNVPGYGGGYGASGYPSGYGTGYGGGYGAGGYPSGYGADYGGIGYGSNYGYGAGGYPMDYGYGMYGEQLMPGEQLSPPKTIIAMTRSTEKQIGSGIQPMQIQIFGTINGRNYPLKTVTVFIHLAGTECLELTPLETMNFESAEIVEGTSIGKKVKVSNKCGESIRALSIDKKKFGVNEMKLSAGSETTIQPNGSLELVLQLYKKGSYGPKTEQLKVKGLMVSTQQFTESAPIDVIINIGKEAAKVSGPATVEESIPVCGEEAKGATEKIDFPRLSEDDCALGYCDAVSFSKWLAKKIDYKLSQVQKKGYEKGYELKNFSSCKEKDFCSFQDMGLLNESFYGFLQHDFVSAEILSKEFSGSYQNLKGFKVDYKEVSPDEFTSAFYANQLFINKNLKGCGRYQLQIEGGMQIAGDKLLKEEVAVIVNVITDREQTKQCVAEIENMLNFLPTDKGLTYKQRFGTWAGMVNVQTTGLNETDKKELIERGREFALHLFDNKERMEGSGTNNLELKFGEVAEGGLLKLEFDATKTGKVEAQTIVATVNNLYVQIGGESAVKKQMMGEIAEAIKGISEQKIDGCITKDKKAFVLKELPADLGKLLMKPEKQELNIGFTEKNCAAFNIQSKIDEKILLKTNWEELKQESSAVEEVFLLNVEGKKIIEQGKTASTEEVQEIELIENKEKKKLFEYPFSLCIKPHNENIDQVIGKEVKVKAVSITRAKVESNWGIAKLEFCAFTPEMLLSAVEKINPKKGNTQEVYFATGWDGPENACVNVAQIGKAKEAKEIAKGEKSETIVMDSKGNIALTTQPIVKDALNSKKKTATTAYGVTCAIASGLCNAKFLAAGWIMIPASAALDCAPGTMALYSTIIGDTTAADALNALGKSAIPFQTTQLATTATQPTGTLDATYDQFKEVMGLHLIGVAGKTAATIPFTTTFITGTKSAEAAANAVTAGIQRIFRAETFVNASAGNTTAINNAIAQIYRDRISAALMQSQGKKLNAKLIQQAIAQASGGITKQELQALSEAVAGAARTGGAGAAFSADALNPTLRAALTREVANLPTAQVIRNAFVENIVGKVSPSQLTVGSGSTTTRSVTNTIFNRISGDLDNAIGGEADSLIQKIIAETGDPAANTTLTTHWGNPATAGTRANQFRQELIARARHHLGFNRGAINTEVLVPPTPGTVIAPPAGGAPITTTPGLSGSYKHSIAYTQQQMAEAYQKAIKDLAADARFGNPTGWQLGNMQVEIAGKKFSFAEATDDLLRQQRALEAVLEGEQGAQKAVARSGKTWWTREKWSTYGKNAGWGKLTTAGFWKTAGVSMLKGLGCALLANAAGYGAYSATWAIQGTGIDVPEPKEGQTQPPVVQFGGKKGADSDGDGKIDTFVPAEEQICNKRMYKAIIRTSDDGKKKTVTFEKVDSIPEGAKVIDVSALASLTGEKPEEAVLLKGDCTGKALHSKVDAETQPVCRIITKGASAQNIASYGKYCKEISNAIDKLKATYPELYVNEQLLVALANVHSGIGFFTTANGASDADNMDLDLDGIADYFAGCGAVPKDASTTRTNVAMNNLEADLMCAAQEMQKLQALSTDGKTLYSDKLTEYYNLMDGKYKHSKIKKAEDYVKIVHEEYNKWHSMPYAPGY